MRSYQEVKNKALAGNEITYQDFSIIKNEEKIIMKKYIRMMKSQRSNIYRNKQIEKVTKMGIDEII